MYTTQTTTSRMEIRLRRGRRRLSSPNTRQPLAIHLRTCHPLPSSLEALDLPTASPAQALASLRFLVLSYLEDLETRLSQLESPLSDLHLAEALKARGELRIEEARAWAKVALEMLGNIRADVCSHLPEFHFADISVENFVNSRLLDFPDVPSLNGMRPHFPDIPDVRSRLPDMPDVRSRLPDFDLSDMRSKLDGVRTRFYDLDFHPPLSYIPTLSEHLQSLHSHLSSMELPSGLELPSLTPSTMLSDLLDALVSSDIFSDLLSSPTDAEGGEGLLEKTTAQVAKAVELSFQGARLIQYVDLPKEWRSNPFITQGYRFIPIERWPLILLSIFSFHNETLNIHSHLVPFIFWGLSSIPLLNSSTLADRPETVFTAFALVCLFSSTLWHVMSGCAHPRSMEFCARVDYVGIGWLISASVGTIVHYGFQCHPDTGKMFLVCCFLTALAGNIFPFMDWFNQYEYRIWRITFFLALALSGMAPLAVLAFFHTTRDILSFIWPVMPSLLSYVIGLIFYVSHVPERFLTGIWAQRLNFFGGSSHAIWHAFIVLAISQHKVAIRSMREGIVCQVVP